MWKDKGVSGELVSDECVDYSSVTSQPLSPHEVHPSSIQVSKSTTTVHDDKVTNSGTSTTSFSDNVTNCSNPDTSCTNNHIVSNNISPIPRLNTQVSKPTTTVHEDKVTNSSTLTTCASDNVTNCSSSATSCANNQIVSNNISPIPRLNTANMGKTYSGQPNSGSSGHTSAFTKSCLSSNKMCSLEAEIVGLKSHTGKMVHEYGIPRGQSSPSFHRADTVRTLQKSA